MTFLDGLVIGAAIAWIGNAIGLFLVKKAQVKRFHSSKPFSIKHLL